MLILNADGACEPNPGQAAYGFVAAADGRVIHTESKAIGYATNNIAEWRGALAALAYACSTEYAKVLLRLDAQMVVYQLTGRWRVKNAGLKPLAAEGASLIEQLRQRGVDLSIVWVPREQNAHADAVAARGCRW